MSDSTSKVRELNDRLRLTFVGGSVLLSNGVASLDDDAKRRLLAAVRTFEAFSPDNDPYGEHDFGAVEIGGERFLFKIDYYDRSLTAHSPDKADPAATTRVLTIMRADEY